MPTGTSALKNVMANSFRITDLPMLIVMEASTGHVITTHGVADIQGVRRRDVEQSQALVRKWRATTAVPIAEAEKELATRDGNLQRGLLYWQE